MTAQQARTMPSQPVRHPFSQSGAQAGSYSHLRGVERYTPSAIWPVRVRARPLAAEAQVEPHAHPWAQLAFSAAGVLRVTTTDSTFMVPPSRAVWLPPGVEHTVTVVQDAELRTVYMQQGPDWAGPWLNRPRAAERREAADWTGCRVLEVSALLRELVAELVRMEGDAQAPAVRPAPRAQWVHALLLDELRRARPVPLGVALPRDKRLRSLCNAVIRAPLRHDTLAQWGSEHGLSARTAARLFSQELGASFVQWRQQVLLGQAVALAARRLPMSDIAAELGYASASAFSAMVRRSVGQPPSKFFAQ